MVWGGMFFTMKWHNDMFGYSLLKIINLLQSYYQ